MPEGELAPRDALAPPALIARAVARLEGRRRAHALALADEVAALLVDPDLDRLRFPAGDLVGLAADRHRALGGGAGPGALGRGAPPARRAADGQRDRALAQRLALRAAQLPADGPVAGEAR